MSKRQDPSIQWENVFPYSSHFFRVGYDCQAKYDETMNLNISLVIKKKDNAIATS